MTNCGTTVGGGFLVSSSYLTPKLVFLMGWGVMEGVFSINVHEM